MKDIFAKKNFGAGRDSARGARSNFDEATSDRLVFVGRENILLGIAHCVAGVVSLCKRRRYDHSYRDFNAPLPDDGVLTTGRRNFFNIPHEPSLRISVH